MTRNKFGGREAGNNTGKGGMTVRSWLKGGRGLKVFNLLPIYKSCFLFYLTGLLKHVQSESIVSFENIRRNNCVLSKFD